MGNHSIGRAFVAAASIAVERRRDGETALAILDEAAERTEIRGMDAEFDDAIMPGEPVFALIIEAFGEGEDFSDPGEGEEDAWWDRFYDGPYAKFKERYELC